MTSRARVALSSCTGYSDMSESTRTRSRGSNFRLVPRSFLRTELRDKQAISLVVFSTCFIIPLTPGAG